MKDKRSQAGWGFWLGWVVASTVGWFVGFILSFVLGSIIVEGVYGGEFYVLGSILSGLIGGAVVGAVAGILQWLVLRRRVSSAGWWVLASTAGFIVGFGGVEPAIYVAFGYPEEMGGISSFTSFLVWTVFIALGGAVTGILQWLILRWQVSRAGWWVLASTVGWGCAAVAWAGIRLLEYDYETLTPTLLLLVGGGVVLGAVTGAVLVWLLRQPVPEA
jgi:hypothetical protein